MTTSPWPVAVCPFMSADSLVTAVPSQGLSSTSYPATSEQPTDDVDEEHEHHEYQRRGPRQLDLVLEGHAREVVDEDGQGSRRLHELDRAVLDQPEAAEERREQQGRGLAGRPGHGQHDAGEDA